MGKLTPTLLVTMVLFLIAPGLHAQNKRGKVKVYKVWVTNIDGTKEKGYLYAADKQGITINKGNKMDASNLVSIKVKDISMLELRRKSKVLKGASIGFVLGVTAVLVAGASGDYSTGFVPLEFVAVVVGLLTAGLGTLLTLGRKTILIYGSLEIYEEQLPTLKSYSLKQN